MTWYMRTATYKERERDYVLAARALGASDPTIAYVGPYRPVSSNLTASAKNQACLYSSRPFVYLYFKNQFACLNCMFENQSFHRKK